MSKSGEVVYQEHRQAARRSAIKAMLFGFLWLPHVSGCSSGGGDRAAGESDESIFGKASIPVRAVVVTRAQKPYPLESLEIRASPASAVAPLLKVANEEHERRVASKLRELDRTRGLLANENRRLGQKKQEVAEGYNGKIPQESELPSETSRDDLGVLTKMRAQKSKAVKSYEEDLATTIRPIEEQVRALENSCRRLESDLSSLRQQFNNIVFAALPRMPAKKWVTDANGYATASVSRSEPWYFWTDTTRDVPGMGSETYRWILTHPDDLDDAGKLFLDHRNLLDSRGLVVEAETGRLRTNTTIDRHSY